MIHIVTVQNLRLNPILTLLLVLLNLLQPLQHNKQCSTDVILFQEMNIRLCHVDRLSVSRTFPYDQVACVDSCSFPCTGRSLLRSSLVSSFHLFVFPLCWLILNFDSAKEGADLESSTTFFKSISSILELFLLLQQDFVFAVKNSGGMTENKTTQKCSLFQTKLAVVFSPNNILV